MDSNRHYDDSPSPEKTEPNPYAPPKIAAQKTLPGAAGIDLQGRIVAFSGTLTQRDVTRALNQAGGTNFMLVMAGVFVLLGLALFFLSIGGLSLFGLLLLALLPAVFLYIGYRESGWRRARKILRTSPRSFVEQSGEISERLICYRSQYGWSEYPWESVVGISLYHDHITLAMTPQHSSFIFLPKRFFAAEDWETLFFSLTMLAPALPFRAGNLQQADARRMTPESLPELDRVPPDSIMLDGQLKTSEFLTSLWSPHSV